MRMLTAKEREDWMRRWVDSYCARPEIDLINLVDRYEYTLQAVEAQLDQAEQALREALVYWRKHEKGDPGAAQHNPHREEGDDLA
ncbi:MAG: hypothetical protein ACE5I3_13610 [Phycisphaerae bacterium]